MPGQGAGRRLENRGGKKMKKQLCGLDLSQTLR
ncbi:hypothetical protein HOE425_100077 [Hoeflea sp. EC-HK425]|nr:hypothetical protein HOE425_100077 [Hoeflea sp. EC-HK425]